jgi:hypothetical protein
LNLCCACLRDFSSVSAFDRHRVGKHTYDFAQGMRFDPPVEDGRRCLDEDEMLEAGMELDRRGRWCITRDVEQARKLRISSGTPRPGSNPARSPAGHLRKTPDVTEPVQT